MKKKESKTQKQEILDLLSEYSTAIELLRQYDDNELELIPGPETASFLSYQNAKKVVEKIREKLISTEEIGSLFGQEYRGKFESVIKNIYQTFDGRELYGGVGEKAANLLYLLVKDHPFADGNKRIAAFLFVYFLDKNKYLYQSAGKKKINNGALAALVLLIAISNPKEKEAMVKVISNLIK